MESKKVSIKQNQLESMIRDGIQSWFDIGLKLTGNIKWDINSYECSVVNEKIYLLAKIKYGI